MGKLYGMTPDLDSAAPGVLKTIHTSFRQKRCKEIRKWLRQHPKVTRWCAIDDVDLSLPDKEASRENDDAVKSIFLDSSTEFVRTSPSVGLTLDIAKLAVCFINGSEVTREMLEA